MRGGWGEKRVREEGEEGREEGEEGRGGRRERGGRKRGREKRKYIHPRIARCSRREEGDEGAGGGGKGAGGGEACPPPVHPLFYYGIKNWKELLRNSSGNVKEKMFLKL